jgi:hypothetical protein
VLHVDTASYYSGDWASFTLEGIQRWAQQGSAAQVPVYHLTAVTPSAVLWSRSQGAEIELPPGAGAEIINCGSGSFLFVTDVKKFYTKKS